MTAKFLSLDWFKEKVESSIEKVISRKLEALIEEEQEGEKSPSVRPYLNAKLVNNNLTIVTNTGEVLFKSNSSEKDLAILETCSDVEEIKCKIINVNLEPEFQKIKEKQIKTKAIVSNFDILEESGLFTVEDKTVFLKGNTRSLPPLLVEEFILILKHCKENDINPLEHDEFLANYRFFLWCCLNPRAEVAHELYRFLTENSFSLTKQGFFVALRNVVTVETSDTSLVEFISNAYNKVKAVWKQSPDKYNVILKDGEYSLSTKGTKHKGEELGSLTKMYLDLPNMKENRYTDAWTKTFDIRVGQVVNMPMEECNWSTQDCAAAGLHFTSDQIHYVGCGDTSVLVLINPMKVVGIGKHKGRCYEYLPIMTVPRAEATQILHDQMFDTMQLDEQYAISELEGLVDKVKEGITAETKKYNFNLPTLSTTEISTIVKSLEGMKAELEGRVVKV